VEGRELSTGPAERLAGFVDSLRAEGFRIGPGESVDALRLVAACTPPDAAVLRAGMRSLLCRDPGEWRRFHALFDRYWFPDRAPPEPDAAARVDVRLAQRRPRAPGVTGLGHAVDELPQGMDAARRGSGASPHSTLARADFRFLADRHEAREVERLAERLAARIRRRWTRRRRETGRRGRVFLRATLRRSLATGGTPVRRRYLERRQELPRLVLLHDVSHSMAGYQALLTRFTRGLMGVFPRCEVFVFHTRLNRVTHLYRENDAETLRARLEGMSKLWLGGTRIASALASFNREHAPRMVDGRTLVLVLSDGCDTDDPGGLAEEVARLARRAGRVLWLDPLLERGEVPSLDGSLPAVAHLVEAVLPAHSLEALGRVCDHLVPRG